MASQSGIHITVFAKFQLWLGLAYFYFPGPKTESTFKKTGPKIGPKRPYLSILGGLGLLFWVWNRTIVPWAKTTRNCPGRMNTSPEQETSITYVRTKGHASFHASIRIKLSLTKGRPLWRGHAGARPRRRPAKSCGGGLAECRRNIDDTAVCLSTTAAC